MFAEVSGVTARVDHFVGWVLHMSHHILAAFLPRGASSQIGPAYSDTPEYAGSATAN